MLKISAFIIYTKAGINNLNLLLKNKNLMLHSKLDAGSEKHKEPELHGYF